MSRTLTAGPILFGHNKKGGEKIAYRIKLKDGNKEIEVESTSSKWVENTFEKLRKKYLTYFNEPDKEKLF